MQDRGSHQEPAYHDHEDGSEDRDDDSDDYEPVRRYTESQMSESRTPFNEADMYMAAKYIADFPHFESATNSERWGPFGERVSAERPSDPAPCTDLY